MGTNPVATEPSCEGPTHGAIWAPKPCGTTDRGASHLRKETPDFGVPRVASSCLAGLTGLEPATP